MSDSIEKKLWVSARDGDEHEVSYLLRCCPNINVNWSENGWFGVLHIASHSGNVEVVKLLLAHPDIDVNSKDKNGQTPLLLGCWDGSVSIVNVLLNDPRVDVILDDNDGGTPLWNASWGGHHEVIEWLIASGSDLGDVKNKKGRNWRDGKYYTAVEIARLYGSTKVVYLLENFISDPLQTRHKLRVKLGMLDELAAEVFALIIFICDDLLLVKSSTSDSTTRFFTIASKLPMELQMILCHRVYDSEKEYIKQFESEEAFKSLYKKYT